MTGRERIHHILNRRPVDRLSWTTLIDPGTQSGMPEPERSMLPLDFYRDIGCDVVQFGNHGLPVEWQMPAPYRRIHPDTAVRQTTRADGTVVTEVRTPAGTLTSAVRGGHPVKPLVESIADLKVHLASWRQVRVEEVEGAEEGFRRVEANIGGAGMYFPAIGPSPVQELLEETLGVANFYYLLQDAPEAMAELLSLMHERHKEACEIMARRVPAEAVILVENTSSTLTSPAIYEAYSLPQIRDYVAILHRHRRKAVLHMCGLLKNLLPLIRQTGLDAYNAMTPPTIGDTTFDHALDVLGEDTVILGGVFNGNVFQKERVTREELWRELDALYTPRLRAAHLVLWLVADGLPTPPQRFRFVREWMDRNG